MEQKVVESKFISSLESLIDDRIDSIVGVFVKGIRSRYDKGDSSIKSATKRLQKYLNDSIVAIGDSNEALFYAVLLAGVNDLLNELNK